MDATREQYNSIHALFTHFNNELFEGELREPIICLEKQKKSHGWFRPNGWSNDKEEIIHEISLSKTSLLRDPKIALSTLVHEMVHLWREDFGAKPKGKFIQHHDETWALKMEVVGLMPSDTGQPGGKKTGQKVTHYILPGKAYEKAFNKINPELLIPFKVVERFIEGKKRVMKLKTKYTCEGCETNIWGKPGLNINCNDCEQLFVEVTPEV